jgi:hypothetical protein
MSYKAILLGILLLLAVPAVSSAQVFYQASASGTKFCNNAATKFKGALVIGFLQPDVAFETNNVMAIEDAQSNPIASLLQEEIFATGLTTGGFMYTRNDGSGNISAFAGTFKNDANTGVLTSFTGTFNATFSDGCFETLTIKSGQIIQ